MINARTTFAQSKVFELELISYFGKCAMNDPLDWAEEFYYKERILPILEEVHLNVDNHKIKLEKDFLTFHIFIRTTCLKLDIESTGEFIVNRLENIEDSDVSDV